MKKLVTLLLAAGMVFSAANGASAVEMKVSGSWLASFSFTDNLYGTDALAKDSNEGTFNAAQRIRINFDLVASESLSGRVQLQVANGDAAPAYYTWGTSGVAGTGKTVTARMAYLDWIIPTTDVLVRMGRQTFTNPSYTFSPAVIDTPIDGVVVTAPINDMVGVTFGWLRASAKLNKWGEAHTAHGSADLAYLGVDVAGDGFKVTPWGMVGLVGSNAAQTVVKDEDDNRLGANPNLDMFGWGVEGLDSRTTVYWAGIGGELTMFDPFKFTADFVYSGNDADHWAERKGWYAALGAEMKTSFATPFLRGWYASGDDADSEDSGRMITVNDGGSFDASSIYFDANGLLSASMDKCNPGGTWGVQLGVKNVSFVEDLTHALSVTYFQGTNNTNRISDLEMRKHLGRVIDDVDKDNWSAQGPAGYMTTSDSAWFIDFLSSYKLYQNLTANLLLSYLVTDFDEDLWGKDYENAFRGTLNFTYAF